jgi:DNA-directed RNA polymerase beta' subunit
MKPIKTVSFGVLTEEEIVASGVEITTASNRGSSETRGTPYDLRLGSLENGVNCEACGFKNHDCPGHQGYIRLAVPCYNPKFMEYVMGILKSICPGCASPRIPAISLGPIASTKQSQRFKAYRKKAELIKKCSVCFEPLPSFFIDKNTIKMYHSDRKSAVPLTAEEAHAILLKVSDETAMLLGFNQSLSTNPAFLTKDADLLSNKTHPHQIKLESLIFTVLPIVPTCARPWVHKADSKLDDDLTETINSIIKCNQKLISDREAPLGAPTTTSRKKTNKKLTESDRIKTIDDLTSHIFALIDNSKDTKTKGNSRKQKGLQERLSGKGGQVNTNCAGKRSDFTARTVIVGADAEIPLGFIGVPERIAKKLTKPEIVCDWNIAHFERLLREGKINTVDRRGPNGQTYTIVVSEVTANNTKPFVWKDREGLQRYDIVHRQLQDGDWGIINRQPSLRVESMQGVQIKILRNPTSPHDYAKDINSFKIPLGKTGAFNADFDGDKLLVSAFNKVRFILSSTGGRFSRCW